MKTIANKRGAGQGAFAAETLEIVAKLEGEFLDLVGLLNRSPFRHLQRALVALMGLTASRPPFLR